MNTNKPSVSDALTINRGIKDSENQYILEWVQNGRIWKVYFDTEEELVSYKKALNQ